MAVNDFIRDPKSARGIDFLAAASNGIRGDWVLVEDTWGVVFEATADAVTGTIIFKCEAMLVKKSTGTGLSITEGDRLYLNITTKVVSKTDGTGDILVGIALADATADATTVLGYIDTSMAV